MANCPSCLTPVDVGAELCTHCEAPLVASAKTVVTTPMLVTVPGSCPNCAESIDDDSKFCSSCRTSLTFEGPVHCHECGKPVGTDAKFCKYCAADLTAQKNTGAVVTATTVTATSTASKNTAPIVAAVICLVLSWFFALLPIPFVSMAGMIVMDTIAFILAIICMSKNAAVTGILLLVGSLVVTPILYFVGLTFFAVALVGTNKNYDQRSADSSIQNQTLTAPVGSSGIDTTQTLHPRSATETEQVTKNTAAITQQEVPAKTAVSGNSYNSAQKQSIAVSDPSQAEAIRVIAERIAKAAGTAVSIYKEEGMSGLIVKVKDCYDSNENKFYCIELDYASMHLDQTLVTAAAKYGMSLQKTEFFSQQEFGARVEPALQMARFNQKNGEAYLNVIGKTIPVAVNEALARR